MTTKPAPQPAGGSRAGMKKELPERFRSYKHVWVFIEQERGVVHPVSWELMGEGRKLADKLGVQLAGVVLGGPGRGNPRSRGRRVLLRSGCRLSGRNPFARRLPQ